jgi:hypothetical protein
MTYFFIALVIVIVCFYLQKKTKKTDTHFFTAELSKTSIPIERKDAWEGSFWEAENPKKIEASLSFNYIDGNNEESYRKVKLQRFDNNLFDGMFIGHCLSRNATRTFRYDRVSNVINMDSGEVISNIRDWLSARYETSPEFSRDKLLENDYDTLRILLFMGKADGQFRKDERSIVATTCRLISANSEITDEMVEDMFNNLETLSYRAFQLAVGRVSKQPDSVKLMVFEAVEKMILSQKTVHVVEEEAFKYIKSRFKSTV